MGPKNKKKGTKKIVTGEEESTDQQTNRSSQMEMDEQEGETNETPRLDQQTEQNIKQDGEDQKVDDDEGERHQIEQSNTQIFAYEEKEERESPTTKNNQDQIKASYTMVERVSMAESNYDDDDENEIGIKLDEIYSQLSFLENDFEKKVKTRITVDNVDKKEKNLKEIMENVEKIQIGEEIFHKSNIPDIDRFLIEIQQKRDWKEALLKKVEAKVEEIQAFRQQMLDDEGVREKEDAVLDQARELIAKEDFRQAEYLLQNSIKFSVGQQKELLEQITYFKNIKKGQEEAEEQRKQILEKQKQDLLNEQIEEEKLKEQEQHQQKQTEEEIAYQKQVEEQEKNEREHHERIQKEQEQARINEEELRKQKQQEEEQKLKEEQDRQAKLLEEEEKQKKVEEEEKQKKQNEEQKQAKQQQPQQLLQSTEQPQNQAIIDTSLSTRQDEVTERGDDSGKQSKKDDDVTMRYTMFAVLGVSILAASIAGLRYLRN